MIKYILGVIALISIISSCSNKVDLNSDWKDIPVVYGLIEPHKDTQFIKINKCFLGSEDAYTMAQIADSLNYPYKLNVRVEKWLNGSYSKSYTLDTITRYGLEDGIFATNKNLLYYFVTKKGTSNEIDQNAEYKLSITNPKTGLELTSITTVAKKFDIQKPYINPSNPEISFYTGSNTNNGYAFVDFEFNPSNNGIIHEVYIRFNYIEYHIGSTDSVQKHFDWKIGTLSASKLVDASALETRVTGENFYYLLSSNLKVDAAIGRKPGRLMHNNDQINFLIYVAGEHLSTYMTVKAPSNSIVQDKPEFSNISNGIGIFSSRYLYTKTDIKLKQSSLLHLKNNELTHSLNF